VICTESGGAYYREQTKGGFRGAGLKTGEEEKIYARSLFLWFSAMEGLIARSEFHLF
jgi:hypothetical protein